MNDDGLVDAIAADYTAAPLAERRQGMLSFAAKLTRAPASMRQQDVAGLRALGFVDADVLGIVQVTAYYAYANRIADGLGISLEPYVGAEEPVDE